MSISCDLAPYIPTAITVSLSTGLVPSTFRSNYLSTIKFISWLNSASKINPWADEDDKLDKVYSLSFKKSGRQ